MNKPLFLTLIILLSGCGLFRFPAPSTPEPEEAKIDVVERAVRNTAALVDRYGRFCSAVLAEGIFFTAYHCIVDPVLGDDGAPVADMPIEEFHIEYGGNYYPGTVVQTWEEQDLALLTAAGLRVRDTVPLAEEDVSLGHTVVWTGYPLGLDFELAKGIVSNDESPDRFYIQGQLLPGNSGGPVFNEFGDLVGIVSATLILPGAPFPQFLPYGIAVRLDHLKTILRSVE